MYDSDVHLGDRSQPRQDLGDLEDGAHRVNLKGAQRLTRCLAALSRFISWLSEWGDAPLQAVEKGRSFRWTEQASRAFDRLKVFPHVTLGLGLTSLAGRAPATLHCDHDIGGQHGLGGQA